jgi:hypothetical protein
MMATLSPLRPSTRVIRCLNPFDDRDRLLVLQTKDGKAIRALVEPLFRQRGHACVESLGGEATYGCGHRFRDVQSWVLLEPCE